MQIVNVPRQKGLAKQSDGHLLVLCWDDLL
jgi:hypothetical protein